ncbi:MAG: dehydrogenase [Planctomycetaceae bacterium]|nr:dehydrogenase [Planctomycetaceae bacterium]
MRLPALIFVVLSVGIVASPSSAAEGNRLTYLDGSDPYYVSGTFAKLVAPQWVGEEGVEAVVVLAIDDMNKPEPWVSFLEPTMRRLKEIYGYAPLSIMTTRIDPKLPDWAKLLAEGVTLECHTYDHPCPILRRGDFQAAKETYDRCVEVMNQVPGNAAVAFRVPCCDSLNTPSPRFYAEIFNKTNANGQFLRIDSSVFNVLTPDDPQLPRELVTDADGREKFRKYIPFKSFVNTIENYPYPYVIGRLCWEFPCATPSDWEAQHLNKPGNARSLEDMKAALDAVVIKQGTFNLVFHSVGWIRAGQVAELVDHAADTHGRKVRFLSFKECHERLVKHLLAGEPLRADDGGDNGVRLLDLNGDGYLDVVIGNERLRRTRVWSPKDRQWIDGDFPVALVDADASGRRQDAGVHFGVLRPDGNATLLVRNERVAGVWHFDGSRWIEDEEMLVGLELDGQPVMTDVGGRDQGVRLRDVDADGRCEVIVGNSAARAVFAWDTTARRWRRLSFALPALTRIVDSDGRDAGLRFVDVDEDGNDDVMFSDEQRFSLHLFRSAGEGWSREVLSNVRGQGRGAIPMIAWRGTNNGAWFHSRHLWVQNEHTAGLADLVDRRAYNDLLKTVPPRAKSPAASLGSMRVQPGFRVELVAAEPLVSDPIAIAWGADGRLWVAEMGDYPLGADGQGTSGGRVRYLEDSNGDGRYDRSTLFLEGLGYPTSVMPWRKGVVVTCAPEILYAEDTNGDGKADRREVLYSGFVEGNQQHRVNGLRWGLDGWVYCANGDSGGKITSSKTGRTVDIRGRDFRIRPKTGELDPQTSMTQFGRCRDDWGNWFGGNSGYPFWHCVLADQYTRRNPNAASPDPRVYLVDPPAFASVFPISRTLPRFNAPDTADRFTSACGAGIYRDELFGPNFSTSYFVCEPVHNLVHHEVLSPKGVTFTGSRAAGREKAEFLASSDNWFRPTQVRTGPDGALWVVDMYRFVIEHPEWIPKDWQQRLDLRAGHDKGRIYRIYPVRSQPRSITAVDRLDSKALAATLESPNGPARDLSHQLLLERQDKSAVAVLEGLVNHSSRAASRVQALCALDGLGGARPWVLRQALDDRHGAVRRHAVRLCESRLESEPELADALLARVADSDPTVRLQLAYTLGAWDDPRAGGALARIAIGDIADKFIVAAVLSSASRHCDELLAGVLGQSDGGPAHVRLVRDLLLSAIAGGQDSAIVQGFEKIGRANQGGYAAWQFEVVSGVLDALARRQLSLATLQADGSEKVKQAVSSLAGMFASARRLASDDEAELGLRSRAVRLLGRGLQRRDADVNTLIELLAPQRPGRLQTSALATLGQLQAPEIPKKLLDGWQQYAPALRAQTVALFLNRSQWTPLLLERVASKHVSPTALSAAQRQFLLTHESAELRRQAAAAFQTSGEADRLKVVERYREALALKGDSKRGETIFREKCSTCHQLGGWGYNVGPDLRALTDRSPQSLLVAILDPNRAVETRYVNYAAATLDGRVFTGAVVNETGNSITLVNEQGLQRVLLRAELEEFKSTGKSMMPEGLEKEVGKPQELSDLFAYVGANHPQRKQFAGNQPRVISADEEGTLRLAAETAELYGPDIYYYAAPRVLGDWHEPEDRAVWSMDIAVAGRFEVWLEWACANNTAGNTYLLEVNTSRLSGAVAGTGNGWSKFLRKKIGELELKPGLQSLVFRSDGEITKQALLDLRSIQLVPVKK